MKPHWELAFKSAWELHSLIVKKDVSPVEIIKDALKRLEELNPTLNAFLTVTPEIAIEEAKKAETTDAEANQEPSSDSEAVDADFEEVKEEAKEEDKQEEAKEEGKS